MPLFVAIFPPREIRAAVQRITEESADGVRWITPEFLHITLRFFGDAPRDPIVERLSGLEMSHARATLGPATSAPWGPRTLVLPVHGVDRLAAEIAAATADIGHSPDEKFFGHLGIAQSDASVEGLVGIPLDAAFDVRTVTLIESDWSSFPPRYTNAGEFAVASAQ